MSRPVNRLARLLQVLEWHPALDADGLASRLGTTPGQVRRDLRDLRDAGAFDGADDKRAIAYEARALASARPDALRCAS